MIRRTLRTLLAAATLACLANPVAASTRPGVEIKFTGITGPARAGVPVTAQVTLTAHEPTVLKQFALSARGVTVTSDAPPDSIVLADGGSRVVNLSFVPGASTDELVFTVRANGVELTRRRNLSQHYFDLLNYGATVGFDPQPDPPAPTAPAYLREQRPTPARALPARTTSLAGDPVLTLEQARRRAALLGAAANESHHLHGRIRFKRDDGSLDYADGASYTLWLDAPAFDVPLASGVTSSSGGYDETVVVPSSWGRKFYLVFASDNGYVHVLNNSDSDEPFVYRTSAWDGVTGGGDTARSFLVSNLSDAAPLHILTMVTRAFRWVLDHTSYTYPDDIDDVDVAYPDSDWPHYAWPFTETINVPDRDWAFEGSMLIHEFGHHVNYELPIKMLQEDTEDGNCEPDGSPGRHCAWCAEDDLNVAVGEGFAQFFEQMASLDIEADYGVPVRKRDDWELLPAECNNGNGNCGGCSPYATEGYFGALLTDLADSADEQDPMARATATNVTAGAIEPEDRLSLGFPAVLDLMVDYDISTVQDFVDAFEERYGASFSRADIFNTFANAGYWRDGVTPLPPSNPHSTDHTANTPSPDNSISFAWTPAVDLHSGIQSYTVDLIKNGIHQIWQHPESPSITFSDLGPGTYRIEVWATDLQGNVSTDLYPKAVSPNYVVRDPYQTDLREWLRAGWTDGLVARCITGATSSNCTDTPTLAGNQDSTWVSWAVDNTGEVAVDGSFRTRLLLDGEPVDSVSTIVIVTPPNSQTVLNRGPFTVRGGRHTLEAWTDASEVVPELSESNNRWGRQFVFKPLALARNTDLARTAPPDRLGGSNVISVPIGQPRFYNCDGFSYSHALPFPQIGTYRWMAAELWGEKTVPKTLGADYDLMLHYPSDGSNDGFTDGLVTSSRGNHQTDCIITNQPNLSQSLWNLGVVNTSGSGEDFHVRVNSPGNVAVGDSVVLSFAQNQMVVIRDLDVTSGNTGKLVAELRRVSGGGHWHLSWIGSTATYRTLSTADGTANMDSRGLAQLSFTASSVAHYALVAWRDPSDGGTTPATLSLKIWKKPADLAVVTPAGWYAPLVPRPLGDATAGSALQPGYLYGDDKNTWISLSKRNASDVTSGFNNVQVRCDDDVVLGVTYTGLLGLTTYTSPNAASPKLPGGRHVLSLLLDPTGVMPELDELNNTYGEQWSWIPDTITAGTGYWRRGQIGGPMAGWEYCLPTEYLTFDCDGTRLPAPGAGVNFAAVAAVARDTADVDLALHDPTNTADAGFETPLEDSNWGPGETDLVVLHYGLATRKAYDASLTRVSDDTASVALEFAEGVVRSAAQNVHGPFTLGAGHLVQVHEFALPAGRYALRVRNVSGSVDWAMAVYDTERPFQDRSQGEEQGWAWANGPGEDETFVYYTPVPRTVAIVVYKTGSGEVGKSGTYQLELNPGSAGVGDGSPVAITRLAPSYPNPFRDRAQVRYDLARAEDVTLEVYDVRGARVRTLARERREAGRWTAEWDGLDAAGRRAPAGVYLVRFAAGAHADQQKLVRIE